MRSSGTYYALRCLSAMTLFKERTYVYSRHVITSSFPPWDVNLFSLFFLFYFFRTRCEEATCIKQASFAMEGDRYPKFCKDHRQEDMINIRNHRCIAPGCSRGASFAVSGSRGQYCSEHKAAGMINTRRR